MLDVYKRQEEYYAQQLFETKELTGYLKTMINSDKSPHEQVIYQSDTERTFAEQLEKNEAVKVYAKLPSWFRAVSYTHLMSICAPSLS